MTTRYVYFFQDNAGNVKVGESGDPRVRLRTLSTEVGHRLTVIGVMTSDDARKEEAAIHRALDKHRLDGEREWFRNAAMQWIERQTWVSPMLYEAISTRAKNEGRPLANHVRRELGKLHGVDE